jgi:hypothetical protein
MLQFGWAAVYGADCVRSVGQLGLRARQSERKKRKQHDKIMVNGKTFVCLQVSASSKRRSRRWRLTSDKWRLWIPASCPVALLPWLPYLPQPCHQNDTVHPLRHGLWRRGSVLKVSYHSIFYRAFADSRCAFVGTAVAGPPEVMSEGLVHTLLSKKTMV